MTKLTTERVHDLKIYPEFFSAVCTGIKRAELRKNDRDYRVGDVLHLCEFSKTTGRTGEYIDVIVTHIADVSDWLSGYVLLSIKPQENDAAPVLPKQPELLSIGELLQRLEEQTGEKWVEESAQHVIPGQLTQRMAEDKTFSLGAVLYDEEADIFADGWNACRAEMLKAQQNEPQNIPENIPAQPVSEPSNSPVIPDAYVLNELGRMTLNGVCEPRVSFGSGWNACRAEMLKAQPVSEPSKLNGWISVDNELPEEGAHVLVFSYGAFVLLAEFTGGEFYDVARDGEEFFETVTRCVTHWMPLPAAPAQEQK